MKNYNHLTDRDCPRPRSKTDTTGIPFVLVFQYLLTPISGLLSDRDLSLLASDLIRYSKVGGLEAELTVSQLERLVEGCNTIAFFTTNPEIRSAAGLSVRAISKSVKVQRALTPIVAELAKNSGAIGVAELPEFTVDSEIDVAIDRKYFIIPSTKTLTSRIRSIARQCRNGVIPIELADLRNTKQSIVAIEARAAELAKTKRW